MASKKSKRFQLRLWHLFVVVVAVSLISWVIFEFVFKPETYEREEVPSDYGYPPEYHIKPISEQVKILREYFPELVTVDETLAQKPLPKGAEGYFAIPRWQKLATHYGEALDRVLAAIAKQRPCTASSIKFLETAKKAGQMESISRTQNYSDILIVPAQFGLRHRGRSVRRARAVMNWREFGLGAYEVACMLLTHPERLIKFAGLLCYGAGDRTFASGCWSRAPIFESGVNGVGLFVQWVDSASESCGSASGFVSR